MTIYQSLALTLTTSCPDLLLEWDESILSFTWGWNDRVRDVELAFYDLSDRFKEQVQGFDSFTVVGCESEDRNFIVQSIANAAINSLDYKDYRSLAFLFLDRFKDNLDYKIANKIPVSYDDEFIRKLNTLYEFGKHSTAAYAPLEY